MRPPTCLASCAAVAAVFFPLVAAAALAGVPASAAGSAAPPDYGVWTQLLARHYDPDKGMNYKALKAQDAKTLADLRQRLAAVDAAALAPHDRLAYWINVYNVNVVSVVVDHYPVKSIRDLSTDPIIRLNVFKQDSVPVKGGAISLNDVENAKIREPWKDPRIHFAINCAARSCPPIRPEAFAGARIGEQLDDQARKFLNDPRRGVQIESKGADGIVIHVTKVMDWFADDFEKWGGGRVAFIRKYVTPDKQKLIDGAQGKVELDFYSYDWALNDAAGK